VGVKEWGIGRRDPSCIDNYRCCMMRTYISTGWFSLFCMVFSVPIMNTWIFVILFFYLLYISGDVNLRIICCCQAPVAHACNPSCSGGSNMANSSSKPAQENSSARPYLGKKPFTKKGWLSSSRCRPWVQTPVPQKKKLLSYSCTFFL
jgi:hypothetical protein